VPSKLASIPSSNFRCPWSSSRTFGAPPLSHQNEVQNSNYSRGFKAKTATKPAPKTARKLYQAMELAHTFPNE